MAVKRRYGQKQTVTFVATSVFTKYGKSFDDVSRVYVTLKRELPSNDEDAAFNKNSGDDPTQVSLSYDAETGVYTISATILHTDFSSSLIRPNIKYYVGFGITFSDEDSSVTFEPDAYSSDDEVIFSYQRIDTLTA